MMALPRRRARLLAVLATVAALAFLPAFTVAESISPSLGMAEAECEDVARLPAGQDRCAFARAHCPTESLIPYLTLYYCAAAPAGILAKAAALCLTVILLIALFRALGETAGAHFAPAMASAASAARLPPRLAGATLLALGNGAPDIASSFAAARTGRRSSIELAFSALLGAGLFVGCVVGGLVVRTAGGAPARGALLRDVTAYAAASTAAAAVLGSGAVTPLKAGCLLGLYGVYVASVAAADAVAARQRAASAGVAALLSPDTADEETPPSPPTADLPLHAAPPADGEGGSARAHTRAWDGDELELSATEVWADVGGGGGGRPHPPPPPSYDPASGPGLADSAWTRSNHSSTALSALTDRLAALASAASTAARVVELPLALARSATIPVPPAPRPDASSSPSPPADPWLPVACVLGPLAGAAYAGAPWFVLLPVGCAGAACAAALALGCGAPPSPLHQRPAVRGALTALSAVLAVLWVDATAAALVGALQLLTTVGRAPPALAGATLLAWGNSAGDAAANVAIARAGLPNMALTACFAGPATNLLLGLGGGLLAGVRARAAAGKGGALPTRLTPAGRAATGFVWAMAAVVLGCSLAFNQRLPRRAAWVLGGVYAAHMVVSVSLAATPRA